MINASILVDKARTSEKYTRKARLALLRAVQLSSKLAVQADGRARYYLDFFGCMTARIHGDYKGADVRIGAVFVLEPGVP